MMKIPRQTTLAAALCAGMAMLAGPAQANDDVKFKGGGFGTLGAVRTNVDGSQFRTDPTHWSGADKHVDLGVDSRLGLQGTVMYKSDFSVTAQLLGIRREDKDFDIDFEWLYAQYTGIPGLNLKAGRVALPAFLVSDSRRVGYTTPWLRVPPLAYTMLSLSTVDGAQASYSKSVGPAVASVQYTHGRGKSNLDIYGELFPGFSAGQFVSVVQDNVNSLNAMLEWGDWTARVGRVTSEVSGAVDVPAFGISQRPLDPFKDIFTGFGLQYDNGKTVVIAEYLERKTKPANNDAEATSWYVGGGYRFGEVMPYVLVSEFKLKEGEATKGAAVGARYDFAKNVALKAEYARYDRSGYIFLDSVSAPVNKVNVISVALDFVF